MKKLKTVLLAMCAATLASISINAYANAGASYIYENLQKQLSFPINVVIQDDGATFVVESTNPYYKLWDFDYDGDFSLTNDGQDVYFQIANVGVNFQCEFTGNGYGRGMWMEGKCDK
jgi:hypothetical protein